MKKRLLYVLAGIILLAGAVFFGVKTWRTTHAPEASLTESLGPQSQETAPASQAPAPTEEPAAAPETEAPEETPSPEPEETDSPAETALKPFPYDPDYDCPVDFDRLKAVNPDIYAWIEIEDTNISYPLVQSETDDTYYLDHNSDLVSSANGALFSESQYNAGDMTDAVTVLYGHHMKSGVMFGNLQQYYTDSDFFREDRHITVYTPDAELEYAVFAAMPWSNEHLLYYNDFTDPKVFQQFFSTVFNARDLSARFNEENAPGTGDRVLILSTCLAGNNTRRFLVMATLVA